MDVDMILDRIDSLWLFSNLLNPSPLITCTEKPKETQPTAQDYHQNASKVIDQLEELTAEAEEEKTNEEPYEDPRCIKEIDMEQRRVKNDRKQSTDFKAQTYPSRGDMGSEAGPVSTKRVPRRRMRRTSYMMERFDSPVNRHCALPSFGDSLAMKQHLKSWAQAVASAVR